MPNSCVLLKTLSVSLLTGAPHFAALCEALKAALPHSSQMVTPAIRAPPTIPSAGPNLPNLLISEPALPATFSNELPKLSTALVPLAVSAASTNNPLPLLAAPSSAVLVNSLPKPLDNLPIASSGFPIARASSGSEAINKPELTINFLVPSLRLENPSNNFFVPFSAFKKLGNNCSPSCMETTFKVSLNLSHCAAGVLFIWSATRFVAPADFSASLVKLRNWSPPPFISAINPCACLPNAPAIKPAFFGSGIPLVDLLIWSITSGKPIAPFRNPAKSTPSSWNFLSYAPFVSSLCNAERKAVPAELALIPLFSKIPIDAATVSMLTPA